MIVFTCENCGTEIKVADEHAGRMGKCAKCGQRMAILGRIAVPLFRYATVPLVASAILSVAFLKQYGTAYGAVAAFVGLVGWAVISWSIGDGIDLPVSLEHETQTIRTILKTTNANTRGS